MYKRNIKSDHFNDNYHRLVKFASIASLVVVTTIIFSKLLIFALTNSSTLLASLTDSVMDLLASLINFIAIRYSMIPADDDHKYGHFKAESLASLAQCTFILGSSLFLVIHGVLNIISPRELFNLDLGIIVSIVALILTILLTIFQTYVIKKTKSNIIVVDRLHFLSDIFFNIIVIVSLMLSFYGIGIVDGLFSVLLGLYIAYGALRIGKRSLNELLDKELPEKHINIISAIIKDIDGVIDFHDLRTRRTGPRVFIQADIEIFKNVTLEKAHYIADLAEEAIIKHYPGADITLHMEPTDKEKK